MHNRPNCVIDYVNTPFPVHAIVNEFPHAAISRRGILMRTDKGQVF